MTTVAPTNFFSRLSLLYPRKTSSGGLANPWYIVAAVAYSASNRPKGVADVFQYMLQELKESGSPVSEQLLLAQKLREAVFKSGLTSGYPRTINSLKALHEIMPGELREKKIRRDTNASLADYEKMGLEYFQSVYGKTAEGVQKLLDDIYPEMGYFSQTIGYGFTYSRTDILSSVETSYTLVAALIAVDTPLQISWHLNGARRQGATLDEVRAVRQISMEVARECGVQWTHEVPEVLEKLPEEQ